MYGLSGLKVLDLSYNHLTNVVEQNFDGLYSLKHLCLANNHIKSMVSAAFRHVQMLETLSLKNNLLTGKKFDFYKQRTLMNVVATQVCGE